MPFEPYRTEFSVANAAMMAELARAVYLSNDEGAPDAEAILEELQAGDGGFQGVWPFDMRSSQACVVVHEDFICAAFRGTNELADWRDNVQVGKVKGPFGRVHRGFQSALMDVWPAMRARLANYPQRPLWLTGHSLGGAMATLAAAQLADADESFIGVYTFGSPRCGGKKFSRVYEIEAGARSHRVHNNSDIVTRFPTRQMNYRHVGRLAYITESGEIKHDTGWWYRFCNRVRGAALDLGEAGLDAIKDHGIGEYAEAIRNATTHVISVSQAASP